MAFENDFCILMRYNFKLMIACKLWLLALSWFLYAKRRNNLGKGIKEALRCCIKKNVDIMGMNLMYVFMSLHQSLSSYESSSGERKE
ncbi:CLUMA_CG019859, isoform A [Clunio marinus]|uniref:CLUMA_CG019859, isoform A n=1 Tax=Clunio marinus TaxID=568069 RepID=A0A1J1J2S7_9DIPT|nr:CLUMA_CG019859, isoform A [Clunio marinus]